MISCFTLHADRRRGRFFGICMDFSLMVILAALLVFFSLGIRRWRNVAKSLRRNVQCRIKLAGQILERYQRGKFNNGGVVKVFFEARHQFVIHPAPGDRDGDSVGQGRLDAFIEQRRDFEIMQGCQMRPGQAALEAGGGVDVNAKCAPIDLRYQHRDERTQRGFDGRRLAIQRTVKHRQPGKNPG